MACTPGDSAFGAGYPTSSDCPPTATTSIGIIPVGATLTTGQVNWTGTIPTNDVANTASAQTRDFVGYCRDLACPGCTGAFEGDPGGPPPTSPVPHLCWENGVAVGNPCAEPYETCEQRNNGAFGPNGGANKTITQFGSAPGCLADELPHASRVVGPLRLAPTFNPTIDAAADFPGPGVLSLDGNMQVQ
jgi:hypothetical protein